MGVLLATNASGCREENPFDFGGPRDCSITEQNAFMYTLMQEAYLWNEFVPDDVDPAAYASPSELVTDIRYDELDRWSRVSDLVTSDALFNEGMVVGMGFRTRRDPADAVVLGFVDPLSPAGQAGLQRGDVLVGVGSLTAAQLDADDGWGDAFGESEPGITVDLQVQSAGEEPRTVSVTKDWYPLVTVPYAQVLQRGETPVGYVFFTTFVEPSIDELSVAFAEFAEAGVREVIVDFRYNGGGRLSAARHLMNLLVGGQASGQVAYRTEYAPQLSSEDRDRDLARQSSSLDALDHVVFINTGSTASASELVINAVRPYARVSVVGSRSAGKPVGSAQWTFCDKAAHPITFRLLNAEREGDYFNGIEVDCEASDGLDAPLGDPNEAAIAAALALLGGESCPAPTQDDEGEEARAPRGDVLRARPVELPGAYPGLDELRSRY